LSKEIGELKESLKEKENEFNAFKEETEEILSREKREFDCIKQRLEEQIDNFVRNFLNHFFQLNVCHLKFYNCLKKIS